MIDVRARDNSGARNRLRFLLRGLSAALALALITGCGNRIYIVGTPVVTLTAQRGQFTSYIVTIDQIEMTRQDGTVVEFPTIGERVDLAHLSNFTQLLEAPAIGEGTYVSATFFLDYSAPYVTIDANGQAGATTLIDAITGTAPGTETLTVTFDPNNPLVIGNRTSSLVNFNIDLEAFNTVDNSKGLPATVTIHPVMTVTAAPVYEKPVFARGLFVFTDTKGGTFTMNTRPLHDVLNNPFGAVTIVPSDQTYYNINGVTYVGAAGLTALAALQGQTATLQVAAVGTPGNPFGNLSGVTPTFTASQVYVGSSLESTIQDHVTGIVAGRTSTTLNVMGAALVDRLGQLGFTQTIPVTIASTTIVSEDGVAASTPTIDTVSVGQLIDVSGQVSVNTNGSNNPTALDATLGQIRIQPTTLWGTLNSATPGSAVVNLEWVEHYEPTNIVYTGTGTSSSLDATAGNYTINTGATDLSTTPANTLLQFAGVTNAFGQGPPDFNATTVTPASSLPQQLIIEWSGSGSPNPFTALAANGISINLQDANLTGTVHVIRTGPQTTDVMTLPNPNPNLLVVVPATGTPQSQYLFSIGNVANKVGVFSDPTAFAARIQYYTGTVGPITKLVATGQYDGAGHFVATNIEIAVH
jgi:hypothetical protein